MLNRPWMGTPAAARDAVVADVEVVAEETRAGVGVLAEAAGAAEEPLPPRECSRVTKPTIAVISVAIPVSTPGSVVQNARKPPWRGGCSLPKDGSSFPICAPLRQASYPSGRWPGKGAIDGGGMSLIRHPLTLWRRLT
jgi:hypothetical protein